MDTDRELLELAAKAAGIEGEHCQGPDDTWRFYEPYRKNWNPLKDDGDALRLAVKLRMRVNVCESDAMTTCFAEGMVQGQAVDFMGDPYAATRRAIVRAAAEIGRAA